MDEFDRGVMLETFIHEMGTLVDQLENTMIQTGETYTMNTINEIFRVMHTIKGSASMMLFTVLADVTHVAEDIFFFLRENNPDDADYPLITDLVLEVVDFVKLQLAYMESEETLDDHPEELMERMKEALAELKGVPAGGAKPATAAPTTKPAAGTTYAPTSAASGSNDPKYTAKILFQEESQMENVRAFTIVHNIKDIASDIVTEPDNLLDEETALPIREHGFVMHFRSSKGPEEIESIILKSIYVSDLQLEKVQETGVSTQVSGGEDMNTFEVVIRFQKESQMENVRSFALINNLGDKVTILQQWPEDLLDEASSLLIKESGFKLTLSTRMTHDALTKELEGTIYLEDLSITQTGIDNSDAAPVVVEEAQAVVEETQVKQATPKKSEPKAGAENEEKSAAQKKPAASINVSVSKLDQLLNLVGELVISEAMVTQNPELEGLDLENFTKESRQLRKIIVEVQHTVTSMRMVPLTQTFFKMNRIVRDMCRQLNKNVQLEVIGDETEVDKNIIEHIADPLMHIIRNSVDHGIEMPEDRVKAGKPEKGTVVLEAKNSGGDVFIIIRDDGAGFKKDKILAKAKQQGMLTKAEEEYTEKEIYQFIFKPGFSTNEQVTTFSGRGVGMDVVNTNLDHVGGSVIADSVEGEGSSITLKIPLTLAIIEGMLIRIGEAKYAIPIMDIKRSLKATEDDIVFDPNNNEMIKIRGEVYNLVRLNRFFGLDMGENDIKDGIVLMLENGDHTVCVFADELIGEQQIVVKNIPKYIKKVQGLSGCTLLGNGDISLIINVAAFFDR